ncbi:uncharacterized protein LOC124336997 isoform X2 [Daphnia pulicaria]|uniref:uncharacterized protein LOC124336997 isoform X2 n=1 Tax=Daphnia pulicaria TaxID=35523 RepID=UPI001EEA6EB6|nr:uncharacterized protein LOC124336997 isoform X2 [Daphnia pulicaria]
MARQLIIGLLLFCVIVHAAQSQELKNGTACKEEILQLVCESETEVLVIHRAVFDGQDSDGCGFLMPINISSLLPPVSSAIQQQPKNITDQEELQEMIELDSRRRLFSVQSTVNRRCSGLNNCTVQLENDEPQAKQWGDGKLQVLYNCIPAKSARYSCDAIIEIVTPLSRFEIVTPEMQQQQQQSAPGQILVSEEDSRVAPTTMETAGEVLLSTPVSIKPKWYPGPEQVVGWGYLHNMGYPSYYRGSNKGASTGASSGAEETVDCRWTVRATHGRRVRLTLLDLSIRSVLHGEHECKDVLTVTEHSRLLLNKCGQVEEPLVIESSSDEINITLSVKSHFIPKRGLMAYFTAMGCPTPRVPKQGYLVTGSNSSRAEFICSVDHVFPDTGLRFRNLTCLDQEGHRWNEDLPDCIDIKHYNNKSSPSSNHTPKNHKAVNRTATEPEAGELTYSLTYDLIVPTSIIAGLILGNLIVLAGVIHCRRRNRKLGGQKVESGKGGADDGEECVPLQETPGPSDVPQNRVGTPV